MCGMEANQFFQPASLLRFIEDSKLREWRERTKQQFKKGEQLCYPGKLDDAIYMILAGDVRIFHLHEDGKECVLGILSAGDFIDLPSAFTEKTSGAYSIALTDVEVVKITKQEIREVVQQTPELSFTLLTHFAIQMQDVISILEQVAYDKVEERLIKMLIKLADTSMETDEWYPLPAYLTHRDIAGMIASTRETVTFLLNKLTQNGTVKIENNRIWISSSM